MCGGWRHQHARLLHLRAWGGGRVGGWWVAWVIGCWWWGAGLVCRLAGAACWVQQQRQSATAGARSPARACKRFGSRQQQRAAPVTAAAGSRRKQQAAPAAAGSSASAYLVGEEAQLARHLVTALDLRRVGVGGRVSVAVQACVCIWRTSLRPPPLSLHTHARAHTHTRTDTFAQPTCTQRCPHTRPPTWLA